MKVTLDLSRLLQDGRITQEEHDRLLTLAATGTRTGLVDKLLGFGVVAVAGSIQLLLPSLLTGMALGAVLAAAGVALSLRRADARVGDWHAGEWAVLASVLLVTGFLLWAGCFLGWSQDWGAADAAAPPLPFPAAMAIVVAVIGAGAVLARSALLAAGATLALSAVIGTGTGYGHASYALSVSRPLVTVLVFAVLALLAHRLAGRRRADGERLLETVARTSLFLVNFAFWVGSLWGDQPWGPEGPRIPAAAFAVAWAMALGGAGVWAGQTNRRWLLNLVAVFGAIHFYTQWFERLGASPLSVGGGGVLLILFAFALLRVNRRTGAGVLQRGE